MLPKNISDREAIENLDHHWSEQAHAVAGVKTRLESLRRIVADKADETSLAGLTRLVGALACRLDMHLAETIGVVRDKDKDKDPIDHPIDHPTHYNSHPSGVECAAITEHMSCMIGAATKYLWRHGLKPGVSADDDLAKAIWCIERERARLKGGTQ